MKEWRLLPSVVAQIWERFRQGRGGPLCFQGKHLLPLVLLHDRLRHGSGNGCASSPMAEHSSVCISSSGNDIACSRGSMSARAIPDSGGTSVASKVMVCQNNQPAGGEVMAASSHQGPSLPSRRGGELSMPGTVAAACLPVERSNLITKGLPPTVVATIQRARASSTRGLYVYKWRAFEQWCEDRNVLPFQCSIVDILTFLQELLDKGLFPQSRYIWQL